MADVSQKAILEVESLFNGEIPTQNLPFKKRWYCTILTTRKAFARRGD